MTDEELKQLVESNARAIQALTDNVNRFTIESRQEQEEFLRAMQSFSDRVSEAIQQAQTEREELRQATIGIANLLASLDQDRPTILRKVTAIENKIDRILERENGDRSVNGE
ncbi:hypothetical protein [Floridanema aerugineum]|uniref:Clp R domain-containing protein n=1 Tax=Floridaenema aerugineum BLCC-F46 TaxID=3153654 RepID=A0ABV4XBT1_9CYAN